MLCGRVAALQRALVLHRLPARHDCRHHAGAWAAATIALLLPLTFKMDPAWRHHHAGRHLLRRQVRRLDHVDPAQHSRRISSVVTCLDGYQMARKGPRRRGARIAAIASFVAGTVGVIGLTLIAPPVAVFALSFSSPEYFALMCLGLALVVLLSGTSLTKGLLSLLFGLWVASIGTDLFTAQARFIFGQAPLLAVSDFMVVAIGVFAIGEVLSSSRRAMTPRSCRCRVASETCAEYGRVEGLPFRLP